MNDSPAAVIVPVRLDALLITPEAIRSTDFTFFRQPLAFHDFTGPEAPPLSSGGMRRPEKDAGVYLHWHIPQAFAAGRADARTGEPGQDPADAVVYPSAPNRWLVLRHHHPAGRPLDQAPDTAGWLVHSDYSADHGASEQHPDGATSPVGPRRWMGRHIDLTTNAWTEPADRAEQLTAVIPGVPTFAAFQPYCQDVFSFHDPLTAPATPDTAGTLVPGRLSYLVAGWHADPGQDVTSPENLRALLDFHGGPVGPVGDLLVRAAPLLRWSLPDAAAGPEDPRTLCHGAVLALPWNPDEHGHNGARPEDTDEHVRIGVGHDMADALDALIEDSLRRTSPEDARGQAGLLRAFHTGRLEIVDHALPAAGALLSPEEHAALDAAHHADWFRATPAGLRWHLTHPPGVRNDEDLDARLSDLNAAQAALDAATADRRALRRRLWDLWWLHGKATTDSAAPQGFADQCAQQLDLAGTGTTASRLADADTAVTTARDDRSRHLKELHDALGRAANGTTLAAAPEQPYQQPVDPGLVIRGAGNPVDRPLRPDGELPLRSPRQSVTKASATDLEGRMLTLTAPDLLPAPAHLCSVTDTLPGALAAAVCALRAELYVLHAAVCHLGLDTTDGPVPLPAEEDPARLRVTGSPGHFTTVWGQPWTPLMLHWLVDCYALPFERTPPMGGADVPCWAFDGAHRTLLADSATKAAITDSAEDHFGLSGRSLLAPVPRFTLQRRVDTWRETFPDDPTEAGLARLRDAVTGWDLTSLSLTGLHAALSRRTPAFVTSPRPEEKHRDLYGPANTTWPVPDVGRYQMVHATHFRLEHAVVVDTFGRSAAVITERNADTCLPVRARSTQQSYSVTDHNGARFVQLPPRLAQPARLLLTALDRTQALPGLPPRGPGPRPVPAAAPRATGGSARNNPRGLSAADAAPVTGWLVVRHTGDAAALSVDVYAPDGTALGTLRRIGPADVPQRHAVSWQPLPGSPYLTPRQVHEEAFDVHGPLAGLVRALLDTDPDAIAAGDPGATATDKPGRWADLADVLETALACTYRPPPRPVGTAMTAGRLLAMVHLRANLELDGPPPTDPADWTEALTPPSDQEADTRRWPVRLGTAGDMRCGLVGYYTDPTCRTLYTDHRSATTARTTYCQDIADGAGVTVTAHPRPQDPTRTPEGAAHVLLLMDPFQSVHAHTDIQPMGSFALPYADVDHLVDRLPLAVPVGPVLAHVATDPPRLNLPAPSPAGTWALAFRGPEADQPWWQAQLTPGDVQPTLVFAAPQARTGYLTYSPEDTA